MFAIAPFLRPFMTKHGTPVPQLHGLGQIQHAVLDVCAYHTSRAFRTDRHFLEIAVLKYIHFFFHNIGAATDGTNIQPRVFQKRRLHPAEIVKLRETLRVVQERVPILLFFRQNILHAAYGLKSFVFLFWFFRAHHLFLHWSRPYFALRATKGWRWFWRRFLRRKNNARLFLWLWRAFLCRGLFLFYRFLFGRHT